MSAVFSAFDGKGAGTIDFEHFAVTVDYLCHGTPTERIGKYIFLHTLASSSSFFNSHPTSQISIYTQKQTKHIYTGFFFAVADTNRKDILSAEEAKSCLNILAMNLLDEAMRPIFVSSMLASMLEQTGTEGFISRAELIECKKREREKKNRCRDMNIYAHTHFSFFFLFLFF
jgi:hypothetical protein